MPGSPRQHPPDPAGAPLRDLLAAMTLDADVFRAFQEMPGPSRAEVLQMLS